MKREYWLYVVAVAAGVLVWVVLSAVSGEREAWDSPLYFLVGIPVLCAVAAALALVEPKRPWRWAVVPLLSQAVWMVLSQGPGNLLLLGLLFFAVLSVPLLIAAWIGAFFGKRRARGISP